MIDPKKINGVEIEPEEELDFEPEWDDDPEEYDDDEYEE